MAARFVSIPVTARQLHCVRVTMTTESTTTPAETGAASSASTELTDGPLVIPVMAEQIEIARRVVEYGRVTVSKRVENHREVVAVDPLLREEIHVERVPRDQILTEEPSPRYEGDTLVLPVVEEVLVVEKRLRLREEVRITRRHEHVPQPEREVTLRAETVSVERTAMPKQGLPPSHGRQNRAMMSPYCV